MEQYFGQIKLFCGNYAPENWAFCNGQILPIAQYSALYSVLGTTYGGDGKKNFALPNLMGAAMMHPSPTRALGSKGGVDNKQFAADNFPAHTHTATGAIKSNSVADTKNNPVGNYPANSGGSDREYHVTAGGQKMAADSVVATVSTVGSTTLTPISNMQPYLAVNFIICLLNGEFPRRP